MKDGGLGARKSAIYVLDQVLGEGRLISELLAKGVFDRLTPADRARAQRLAMETLRGLERADRLLAEHLSKPPPLTVHNALRLGTVELAQGAAAHGVVSSMVAIIGQDRRHARFKGLVNAVMRKTAATAADAWPKMRVPRLPEWLRLPLIEAWGQTSVEGMERAHFAGAALDLTARGDAADLAARLGGTVLPTGSVRLEVAGQVSALDGYAEGAFWVQDAAAALPVQVLVPKAGERILDLCAAPGGKTMQLAAAGAHVTAVDSSAARMERLRQNLARCKLDAETRVADVRDIEGCYDAVLLDAPCSATGTIRRHPDLPHAKDGSDFAALIDLQSQLIDHAVGLLAPGGRLVFCTCSLLPDEGEVQVETALERHPELRPDHGALDRAGIDPSWVTEEGGLRLRPDYWAEIGGLDGFYIACLVKER